ncbi:MAG: cytochrome c oxidase subunit II [Nitrospirota bacterium]
MSDKVNETTLIILIICLVLLGIVTFSMIFLAVRYRKKYNPDPEDISGSLPLEIAWTVIPTMLVFIMFWYGWENFRVMRAVPDNAFQINVRARMWSWNFEYPNGLESGMLMVPVGKPVNLNITSDDVLHSLFIPAFKIKEDAVPGMQTRLWFIAPQPGEYVIFCSEYCGQGHSSMTSKVIAMTEAKFGEWYQTRGDTEAGKKQDRDVSQVMDEHGCLDCHSTDGSVLTGPSFRGIFGKKITVITGGKERELTVDEAYLRTSILSPGTDITKGYPDVMPSFKDDLSEKELTAVISYIEELK